MNQHLSARTRLGDSTKIGQPPPLVELAHAVDFSREAFDDDRTLVAWAVSPRRGHGSLGRGGGRQ
jgi:hypothetical protein